MSDDADLAAVVRKPRTGAAIEQLRAEGVYDDDRHVREFDDDAVAVPVSAPPDETEVLRVVRQPGAPRLRTLEDHLRERGWTDAELDRAPSSWAVLGSVVLVDIGDAPRPGEVGEALLSLHGGADTVVARGPIEGAHREPDVEVIAGEGDTETVHTEHGTRYAMDLSEVMFSPGNKAERKRMGEVVRGERGQGDEASDGDGEAAGGAGGADGGEHVVDMFAGIGYFTLPMARAGATVTAIERNPAAFRYLVENVRLNDVGERVRPYRADCRDVLARVDPETDVDADRVVMGHYDASEYLDAALSALAPGGVVHMHAATPEPLAVDRPVERLRESVADAGRDVEILDARRVKGYSEGVVHVVVDGRVE